jgi:hypothetical protein
VRAVDSGFLEKRRFLRERQPRGGGQEQAYGQGRAFHSSLSSEASGPDGPNKDNYTFAVVCGD